MSSPSTIALFPGEKVARHAPATGYFSTPTAIPGVLHLTNQQLVFWPAGNGVSLDARLQVVQDSTTFSRKRLGFIPAGLALRVSIDTGRVRDEPWFIVEDAGAWNEAITSARAAAPAAPDLAALLTAGEAEGKDAL